MNEGKTNMITRQRWLVAIFCMGLFFTLFTSKAAMADDWDESTKLTFSEPVEVPGQVLPAGSYWFKLADSEADRNIVQIWNADRTQLITTILAIPDYRQNPPEKTIINFQERPSGRPEAIRSWFYPGNNSGEEFVYPKTRAKQLAKQAGQPVLSMPDEQASNATHLKHASVNAVNPQGEEIALQKSQPSSK